MNLRFVERKVNLKDDLRDYATKKVEKLDRYFHKDAEAVATFKEERGRQILELTVKANGMFFRAEETTTDMYASVDGAISSIERQIRKNKTRLEKRLRDGAFDRTIQEDTTPVLEEEKYEVVRRKRFEVNSMTVEEAILQMNLLEHQFYMFKNAEEDNKVAVIYKRANGGYGLLMDE
jgi:putative sigma-54 modulation protein